MDDVVELLAELGQLKKQLADQGAAYEVLQRDLAEANERSDQVAVLNGELEDELAEVCEAHEVTKILLTKAQLPRVTPTDEAAWLERDVLIEDLKDQLAEAEKNARENHEAWGEKYRAERNILLRERDDAVANGLRLAGQLEAEHEMRLVGERQRDEAETKAKRWEELALEKATIADRLKAANDECEAEVERLAKENERLQARGQTYEAGYEAGWGAGYKRGSVERATANEHSRLFQFLRQTLFVRER